METVRQPLVVLDDELRVVSANRSFFDTFELMSEQVVGEFLREIGGGKWDTPELNQRLESILFQGRAAEDFELPWNFPAVGSRKVRISARRLKREKGLPTMLLVAIEVLTGPETGQGITQDRES